MRMGKPPLISGGFFVDCCCSFSGTNAKIPDTYTVKFLVNDSFANRLVPNRGEARGDLMLC